MNAVVQPFLAPNAEDMLAHVEHLFGGYLDGLQDGLVELAWTDTVPGDDGRYKLRHARLFGTDELPELVEEAVRQNSVPMCNVYIGVALRNPGADRDKRTKDADVFGAMAVWCDLDDTEATNNARENYRRAKPTMLVMTGQEPGARAQCFWKLMGAVTDSVELKETLTEIAAHMGGDMSVTNPGRVMRLAGSIAWPQKLGRTTELTRIIPFKHPGEPEYHIDHIRRAFRPPPQRPQKGFGLEKPEPVKDAAYQINELALSRLGDWVPSLFPDAKFQHGTSGYRVSSRALGRDLEEDLSITPIGIVDFGVHDMGDPRRGKRTATELVEEWGGASSRDAAAQWLAGRLGVPIPKPSELDWLSPNRKEELAGELEWFDDITPVTASPYIVKSVLDQGAMSVVYGASNSGKTFFALDLAFHIATGAEWRGLRVSGGSVLYLAAEGGNGIANRIVGLRASTGCCDVPLALRRAGLDLLRPDADTARVIALAAEVEQRAPLKLIVIDTLSRVLAGGDENGPVDMTAFIKNVDRIREATSTHVMVVHHTGKDAARGARGHSSLRAATDTEIEVSEDEDTGERTAKATKQREYSGGEEWRFTLEPMELGKDQDGDPVTTCTVKPLTGERAQEDWLPPMAVCRQMLNAIHEAWEAGNPLTVAHNMKTSGRYAARVLSMQFRVDAEKVERVITSWIDSATVSVEVADSVSKKRGLKVLQWLD